MSLTLIVYDIIGGSMLSLCFYFGTFCQVIGHINLVHYGLEYLSMVIGHVCELF